MSKRRAPKITVTTNGSPRHRTQELLPGPEHELDRDLGVDRHAMDDELGLERPRSRRRRAADIVADIEGGPRDA